MAWAVLEHPAFAREREQLPAEVADKLAEVVVALGLIGPQLGRPLVDTLNASRHANTKEIRFNHDGVWRFAFAFDPQRQAIILVGGNKEGANQTRFYKELVRIADRRFDDWLEADE